MSAPAKNSADVLSTVDGGAMDVTQAVLENGHSG